MATNVVRARDKDTLAQFLGWFSVGLGTAQVAAPGTMAKLVGADDGRTSRMVMRALGVRELTQGVGILARPRPTAWLWSRVAGDVLDLSLLALVATKTDKRYRTAFAIANVLAVTAPDVYESLHLTRKQGEPRDGMLVRKAVTINKPRQDVEAAWAASDGLRTKVEDAGASVRFDLAPGDRGTELAVEYTQAPFAGDLGAAAQKLTGKDLATELSDELRRLKQRLETGEVVRSEALPDGHALGGQLKQRPAQPLEEGAR